MRVVGEPLADDLLEVAVAVLGRAHDQRRLLLDPVAAVDALRELRQRAQAGPRPRLRQRLLRALGVRGAELGEHGVGVDPRVPDVQEAHLRRLGHRRPIRRRRGAGRGSLLLGSVAVVARRHDQARDQALDVPLERRRQRLVEVVEIEHDAAIGRREDAEVRQVRVSAALDAQPRRRGARQIPRHDRRPAAIERERRGDHPPVADRHQLGHTRRVLLLQDADRIRTISGRRPLRVSLQRHRLTLGTPLLQPRFDRLRQRPARRGGAACPSRSSAISAPSPPTRRCRLRATPGVAWPDDGQLSGDARRAWTCGGRLCGNQTS